MSVVKQLEKRLEQLSPSELAEFRRWYAESDARMWDRQLEADVEAGELGALAEKAPRDHAAGKYTNEVTVSDQLRTNYAGYYEKGDSEWRRLGAIGKVDNIVRLCHALPHSSILEIGAGEGSILKRLCELQFADELYALEISPSGIETIENKRISRLVECKVFDGYHIPYANDRFDIAILSHVLEHVEHPRQLL